MAEQIRRSSGDVFRDLGFNASEAHDLKLRSDLMLEIRKRIEGLKEPQVSIAERLGVTQPRVSDLLRGKIHLFSLDTLVKMLERLGVLVDVNVRPKLDWDDWVGLVQPAYSAALGEDAIVSAPLSTSATTIIDDWSRHIVLTVGVLASSASTFVQPSSGITHAADDRVSTPSAADTQLALAA